MAAIHLMLVDPPNAETVNLTAVAVSGQASVSCQASGQPSPTVTWETANLASNTSVVATMTNDTQESLLLLSDAKLQDNGWLECVASNVAGRVVSTTKLEIYCKCFPDILVSYKTIQSQ